MSDSYAVCRSSKPDRKRAFTPKSRRGCINCKKRHVKCDERPPSCLRCSKAGLRCGGYLLPRAITFDILPDRDRRSFYYFRDRTVEQLVGLYDEPFWGQSVLQTSYRWPVIQYGLAALGSLHESLSSSTSAERESLQVLSLQQYTTALGMVRRQYTDEGSFKPLLIAGMVFIYYEIIRQNYAGAVSLLRNGLAMFEHIAKAQGTRLSSDTTIMDDILLHISRAFLRLQLQLHIIVDSTRLTTRGLAAPVVFDSQLLDRFNSLAQARNGLNSIYCTYYQALRLAAPDRPSQHIDGLVSDAQKHLRHWHQSLDDLQRRARKNTRVDLACLLLRSHCHNAYITLSTMAYFDEMLYDQYGRYFARILDISEQYLLRSQAELQKTSSRPLGVDLSIVRGLLVTALCCRVPALRRRAINLLQTKGRSEWLWDGEVASRIARQVALIEGGDLALDSSQGPQIIPKERRIKVITYNGVGSSNDKMIPSTSTNRSYSSNMTPLLGTSPEKFTHFSFRGIPWTAGTKVETCWVKTEDHVSVATEN